MIDSNVIITTLLKQITSMLEDLQVVVVVVVVVVVAVVVVAVVVVVVVIVYQLIDLLLEPRRYVARKVKVTAREKR